MRVGVNATSFGKRFTGIGLFTEFLIDGLCKASHEVYVYCSNKKIAQCGSIVFRETPETISFEGPKLANLKRFWWLQSNFPSILKRDGVQLLITPSVEGLLFPKLPQIVTVHDLMPLRYVQENPRQYYYYRYILPRILSSVDLVLTVSECSRQELIKTYGIAPSRVAVTSTGMRPELFEPRPCSESGRGSPPYFLFVGTFSPRKNLRTVVSAFSQIAASVPERLRVIAYPDPWKDDVVKLASALGISDRMDYESGLSEDELANAYRHATALVLVSEYEGLGAPPLEAMAAGTPVVVSDSTALAEVVSDAGLKVPCMDVGAVASAMLALSKDSELSTHLRKVGRLRAEKYHRSRCIDNLNRALSPFVQEYSYAS